MKRRNRESEEPSVVLTDESPCLYCGRGASQAECEQCDAALESLKILSFAPIVKRRHPVPSV
jgi:hypothetical protein